MFLLVGKYCCPAQNVTINGKQSAIFARNQMRRPNNSLVVFSEPVVFHKILLLRMGYVLAPE